MTGETLGEELTLLRDMVAERWPERRVFFEFRALTLGLVFGVVRDGRDGLEYRAVQVEPEPFGHYEQGIAAHVMSLFEKQESEGWPWVQKRGVTQ